MKVRASVKSVKGVLGRWDDGSVGHLWTVVWDIRVDHQRTTLSYEQRVEGRSDGSICLSWPEDATPTGATPEEAFGQMIRWLERVQVASQVLREFYASAPSGMMLLPIGVLTREFPASATDSTSATNSSPTHFDETSTQSDVEPYTE